MLGGVGYRQSGYLCQFVDAAFALGNIFQQFQPVSITQRLAYAGELGEYIVFEVAA
jgi:hypothetical protein